MELTGWRSSDRRSPSGGIDTEQAVLAPTPVVEATREGALRLGARYWSAVQGFTRGLVRPRERADALELRLLGRGPVLLRFGPPEVVVEPGLVACGHDILGGLLVRRRGGRITLAQVGGEEPELRSTIVDFHPALAGPRGGPRWAGVLYHEVQQRIHRAVGRRYFRRLLREARR